MKKCQCGVSDWQLCQTIYVDVHRGCVAFAHLVDLVAQWQLDLALTTLACCLAHLNPYPVVSVVCVRQARSSLMHLGERSLGCSCNLVSTGSIHTTCVYFC